MKLSDVTARVLEKYYMQLLKAPSVHRITQKANSKNVIYVAPPTARKIHNILRSALHQAVKWELMEKNPAMYARFLPLQNIRKFCGRQIHPPDLLTCCWNS